MTSTGKKARKRYGNRFAAKQRRDSGSTRKRSRRTFGQLPFSCLRKNVPEGAVRANDEATYRAMVARRAAGWPPDANVAVPPGPDPQVRSRESVMAERAAQRAALEAARKAEGKGSRVPRRQWGS